MVSGSVCVAEARWSIKPATWSIWAPWVSRLARSSLSSSCTYPLICRIWVAVNAGPVVADESQVCILFGDGCDRRGVHGVVASAVVVGSTAVVVESFAEMRSDCGPFLNILSVGFCEILQPM